jgi:hypothetical protein
MPRIAFRVVWGAGLTMDTFSPQRRLISVDFPAEGLPATATNAAFCPPFPAEGDISSIVKTYLA